MKPQVTLILPVLNMKSFLKDCITSVLDTAGEPVEFIVLDDGSTDGSKELLESMSGIKLISCEHRGVPKTLNHGMALAGRNDIVRLDADIEVKTQGWLAQLRDVAYSQANIGIVGGKNLFSEGKLQSCGYNIVHSFGIKSTSSVRGFEEPDIGQYDQVEPVDALVGTLTYYKREMIDQVGGIDENYYPVWVEDLDMCIAARAKGFEVIYNPHVFLVHHMLQKVKNHFPNELGKRHFKYWKSKWKWDPEFPDLNQIRKLWGHTRICWRIGEALLDHWESAEPPMDVLMLYSGDIKLFQRSLEGVLASSYPTIRILVFENGHAGELERNLPEKYRQQAGRSLQIVSTPISISESSALNWLLSLARSPLTLILKDSVLLNSHWFSQAVAILAKHPFTGAIAGKVLYEDDPQTLFTGPMRLWPMPMNYHQRRDCPQADAFQYVNYVDDSCVLYRSKVFEKTGHFDTSFNTADYAIKDHSAALRFLGYDIMYSGNLMAQKMGPRKRPLTRLQKSERVSNGGKLYEKWLHDAFEISENALDLNGRDVQDKPVSENEDFGKESQNQDPRCITLIMDASGRCGNFQDSMNRLLRDPKAFSRIFILLPREDVGLLSSIETRLAKWENDIKSETTSGPRHSVFLLDDVTKSASYLNECFSQAEGTFILYITPSTITSAVWLDKMLVLANIHPSLSLFSPVSNLHAKLSNPYLSRKQLINTPEYDLQTLKGFDHFAFFWSKTFAHQFELSWRLLDTCLLFRKKILDQLKGLDSRYKTRDFLWNDFFLRAQNEALVASVIIDAYVHTIYSEQADEDDSSQAKFDQDQNDDKLLLLKKWKQHANFARNPKFDIEELLIPRIF